MDAQSLVPSSFDRSWYLFINSSTDAAGLSVMGWVSTEAPPHFYSLLALLVPSTQPRPLASRVGVSYFRF